VLRRESGILKRLRSTPLPGSLYLFTVLLSNLLIVVLQSLTVIALGVLLWSADLAARPFSFLVALVIGAVCFAGLGLAAAALIRSAEAVAAVVNVIVLPMSFLSGAFGTTDNLPRALEVVADVLPLTYMIELVLATYVDGEPISEHLGAIGVMAAWGAGGYLVARARFGWEPRER
jgi:ABC-2 type transport system permease protein